MRYHSNDVLYTQSISNVGFDNMMNMSPRQLVAAALAGQPTDRVPIFPVTTRNLGARCLGRKVGDFELELGLVYAGMRAMKRRFGFDGLECGFGPTRDAVAPHVEVRDGLPCLVSADGTAYGEFQENDDAIPFDRTPFIKEKADLAKIPFTPAEEYERTGRLDAIRALRADMGDDLFLAGTPAGQSMNSLAGWRGPEQAIYDLVDDRSMFPLFFCSTKATEVCTFPPFLLE